MNTKKLHITNGDNTTQYLKNLNFDGAIITWREMLCEGKTTTEVGSESFWKTRYDFLKSSYKVSKQTFIDKTLKEYRSLCKHKQQDEIVLWFEYDLFCQINMLAVISWLKRYRKGRKITLVQSGKVGTAKKYKGIAELTKIQLFNHYENRVTLTQDDIEYADYIWQLYCSDSPLRLETVHKFNPMSPFVYLEEALKAHLQRFPSINTGLNNVESFILKTAQNANFKSKEELIDKLVKEQTILGFGDVQYANHLKNLKRLFTSLEPVKISRLGNKVIEHQINVYSQLRNNLSYLGGARKYSFLYLDNQDKLLKLTS